MELLLLSADDLRQALPMPDAIEAMKGAFAAYSTGKGLAPPRLHLEVDGVDDGLVLSMAGQVTGEVLAVKVVSVYPGNEAKNKPAIHGLVLVLDEATGEPLALCEGAFLTALRTGAASGAATDLLARTDARLGALIGCGAQGQTQVQAICAARPLTEVRVYDLDLARVQGLIAAVQPTVEAKLVAVGRAEEAVDGADVICSATPSRGPVVSGSAIAAGTHINAVGSFTPEMCEWDEELIGRSRVVVDSHAAAVREAGELLRADRMRTTKHEDWVELGLIAAGDAPGRQSPDEITLFKTVGLAVQDAAAAGRAVAQARARGLGRTIEL